MANFSYSRIMMFKNCPLSYKFKYIDNLIPEFETTIEAHMGSSVHEALEYLYKNVILGIIPSEKEVLDFFLLRFSEEKEILGSNRAPDYEKRGIEMIKKYYQKYYPFDKKKILGVERKISIQLKDDFVEGYVDRIDLDGDILEINDYKTSTYMPTEQELRDNKQLAIYAVHLNKQYDVSKIIMRWHYLLFDKVQEIIADEEMIQDAVDFLFVEIHKIKREQEFKPVKSSLCAWCAYINYCPLFKDIKKNSLSKN